MRVINFYRKGAQVVVDIPSGDMTHSFTAGGRGGEEQIGYVPASSAKPVSGAAHATVKHEGVEYLLLKKGHVYGIALSIGDVVKEDVVSAEHDHLILPLPSGARLVSAVEIDEEGE